MIDVSNIRVQVFSGVTDLTTHYVSTELRSALGRVGGQHQGTEAYVVTLSQFARSVQAAQAMVADSLRGDDLYQRV